MHTECTLKLMKQMLMGVYQKGPDTIIVGDFSISASHIIQTTKIKKGAWVLNYT